MAVRVVADTHAVLWYLFDDPRLSLRARRILESIEQDGNEIVISAISLAEMVYLIDKGRIVFTALDRVLARLTEANANLVAIPFDQNIALAMRQIERDQVPDMPDRIVAATALYVGVPVVSRDGKIKSSVVQTLW